ncbi:hypothetical protein I3843_06G019100 [Carya illinoinensis]|nr:hypothetical protein I3843_06G019100 [Carya illinoinensis]
MAHAQPMLLVRFTHLCVLGSLLPPRVTVPGSMLSDLPDSIVFHSPDVGRGLHTPLLPVLALRRRFDIVIGCYAMFQFSLIQD